MAGKTFSLGPNERVRRGGKNIIERKSYLLYYYARTRQNSFCDYDIRLITFSFCRNNIVVHSFITSLTPPPRSSPAPTRPPTRPVSISEIQVRREITRRTLPTVVVVVVLCAARSEFGRFDTLNIIERIINTILKCLFVRLGSPPERSNLF